MEAMPISPMQPMTEKKKQMFVEAMPNSPVQPMTHDYAGMSEEAEVMEAGL